MDTEATALAGPKGKHDANRAATRHGSVTLGGRRGPVRRPRVLTIASEDGESAREVPLESILAATDLLAEGIVPRMSAGTPTRRAGGTRPAARRGRQARRPLSGRRQWIADPAPACASFWRGTNVRRAQCPLLSADPGRARSCSARFFVSDDDFRAPAPSQRTGITEQRQGDSDGDDHGQPVHGA